MAFEYSPLLKEGFQKNADLSPIESDVSAIKDLLLPLSIDENGNYVVSIPTKFVDNVTVEGTQTIVKTQTIQSENDFIILREGNPLGLAAGAYSGFKIKNYDGNNNNCLLVVDKDGWARIGDENGTIQKIATIQENPTNGAFVIYNTATKQLESKIVNLTDFVKKFTDSADNSLLDNEIGQYQGENTADLVKGFFYVKSNSIPADTFYVEFDADIFVDSTKIINKGIYIYDNSGTFSITTDYVCKYHNGGQPMLYYVKNPSVGDSAITYNMESGILSNVVISAINSGTITDNNNVDYSGTEMNRSFGIFSKFVNPNGDVIYLPFTNEQATIDGSTVIEIAISYINGSYSCYAPIQTPIEIKKSDGSAGGTLTQINTQPNPSAVSTTAAGLCPQLPNDGTTNKYLREDGTWVKPPNTTYSNATTSAAGLMSAADKTKLNGIADNANNYSLPTVYGGKYTSFDGTTFNGKRILSCCVIVTGTDFYLYTAAKQGNNSLVLYGYRNNNGAISASSVTLNTTTTSANAWGANSGLGFGYFTYM